MAAAPLHGPVEQVLIANAPCGVVGEAKNEKPQPFPITEGERIQIGNPSRCFLKREGLNLSIGQ